jgi:uncharacterized repeat protein (TIGR01451 family)
MGIWVSAGPHQKPTFADGSFLIEGVPAGPNAVTFRSDDGEYGATTVAAIVSPGGTTTQNAALTAEAMSTVTFNVTIPGNTPLGAVPRLFGDTYRLGMIEVSTIVVSDTTRMVDMAPAAGTVWSYTVQLGNGTCVNYLYTLGYYRVNYERDANGNKVTRSLCVNGPTTVNDTVTAWKSPQQVPVSLTAVSPPGDEDALYVYVPSIDGIGPTKMWSTGPGTAAYAIYANSSTTLNYLYVRDGDLANGLENLGPGTNPLGMPPQTFRTVVAGVSSTSSNDTIAAWQLQMRETALSTVSTGITVPIISRPADSAFQTGVELVDYWDTAWVPLVAPTVARIKSMNAQWVQIAPVWSFVTVDNPTIEPILNSFPREDLVAHIEAAKSAGLKVALKVEPFPNAFPGPNSNAWYDEFFNQVQSMALYHATIAQQEGVELLILGDLYFGVDDEGGLPSAYVNAKWKGVIAAIRASGYTGKLTSNELKVLPEYDWYGDLDYLGDKWWWPVATTDSDTVQEMYDSAIGKLTSYYLPIENRFQKPFVFPEVAFYSADTSGMQTYESAILNDYSIVNDPSIPSAYDQQAGAYQAVLLAFAKTPWVQGCYSFGYSYFNFDDKGYSIRDKTAENIMSQIYQQINVNLNTTSPVLSISKTHSGSFMQGQQNATYQVTVSNAANAGVTSGTVTVTETVPSGLTLVSMGGNGWICPGTAANNCTHSDVLAPGQSYPSITVTVNVASNATSPQVNAVALSGGGSAAANANNSTTILPLPSTPSVSGVSPGSGSGMSETFTFTFSDSGGWQNLGVQDILINGALDGRHACYIAYVPSGATTGSLYLVDDAGDAGGPYTGMVLPSSQTASNSQCTINGTGSSASGSGNTLTLTLAITFNSNFAGNKIFYLASSDTGTGNSGWQTPATWTVPGPPPTGPAVGGVSPARSNTLSQTYTFTFTDTNGWQDLAVLDILINTAIDGRHACYMAYVPSGANAGSLFLVDDPGDGGGPYTGFVLPGSGTAQNSQCTVGGAGSSVTATGNTLTLTLPITFTATFAGNQVFFLAARSNAVSSDWQAVGSVTVP